MAASSTARTLPTRQRPLPRLRSIRRAFATTSLALALATFSVPVLGALTGSWRLLPILSGSMAPALPTGSLGIAAPVPLPQLRVGEVIAYQAPAGDHHLIAHRIVRILDPGTNPTLQTKGDANNTADPWNLKLQAPTVWVVRANIPLLGYAAVYAKRTLALLLVLLVVAVVTLTLLRRIWRHPAAEPHALDHSQTCPPG